MKLLFVDGPAKGAEIITSVPPNTTRWYCQLVDRGDGVAESWWVLDAPPPDDPDVIVTRYDVQGFKADEEEDTIYAYGVKDE